MINSIAYIYNFDHEINFLWSSNRTTTAAGVHAVHRHAYIARTYVLALCTVVPGLRSESINTYNTRKPNTRVLNTGQIEKTLIMRAHYHTKHYANRRLISTCTQLIYIYFILFTCFLLYLIHLYENLSTSVIRDKLTPSSSEPSTSYILIQIL